MKFMKSLAAGLVAAAVSAGGAAAHTVSIGDSVSGADATIYLGHWHGNYGGVPLAGILMTGGPLSGNQYAFTTNEGNATAASNVLGPASSWDSASGSFGSLRGVFSLTLTGLANGTYDYRLDTSINNGTSAVTAGDTSFFTGSFTITDGVSTIPLPAGLALLLTGLGGLALVGRRRRQVA